MEENATKKEKKESPASVWATLNAINCNEHVEKKKGSSGRELSYLSWAWAWGILKSNYPDASYTVREWDGKPYLFDETLGYLVETSLTVDGVTQTMRLPVMDGANKAQKAQAYEYMVKNPNFRYAKLDKDGVYKDQYGNVQDEYLVKRVEAATMFDINTAIMRCLVKTMALFGLGHYIYAGEDLPEEEVQRNKEEDAIQLGEACEKLRGCFTIDELKAVFVEYPQFENNKVFRAAINARAKELQTA